MVKQHFGFCRELFRADIAGADVFVGPQTATTIAGLKKALSARDAISTVSGPVGSGKTTLVRRAVESVAKERVVIQVARMRLNGADVLELLLEELGLRRLPAGTIQKFSLFRKRLKELQDGGTRILVIVEDAPRLSADTIAELEALTAADSGESDGANIVLMGDEHLEEFLQAPLLARLRQRIRHRHSIGPLREAELRGYLRHCFRLVGSDFESLFASGTSEVLHDLSGGIPRIANNIVESALRAAAVEKLELISESLIIDVAAEEYALYCSTRGTNEVDVSLAAAAATETEMPAEPVPAAEPELAPVSASTEEPTSENAEEIVPTDDPVIVFAEADSESDAELEIPELIQDTLPDLQILAPELANPETEDSPQESLEATATELPVIAVPASETPPSWDLDPTMAELKPDLAVLEEAMSFVTETEAVNEPRIEAQAKPGLSDNDDSGNSIPVITLDNAINERIGSPKTEEAVSATSAIADNAAFVKPVTPAPPAAAATEQENKADTAIERIAAGLAKAKSIEDVDDQMAETLFGSEFDLVAAELIPPASNAEPANDEVEPVVITPVAPIFREEQNAIEVTLEAESNTDNPGLDLSASQRLKTVRALNADLHPSLREPHSQADITSANEPPPDSIEDQINTSLTQTLETLSLQAPPPDEEMDQEKSGFFSRFKRS